MDYQDSRIGFVNSVKASANIPVDLPPVPVAAPGAVPAAYVQKIVQGLEADLFEAIGYAAYLEKQALKKELADNGLPFYEN